MSDGLFDPEPYRRNYRNTDPDTSRDAGQSAARWAAKKAIEVLKAYAENDDPQGLTSWDIGVLGCGGRCWWKRVSELAAEQKLERVGKRRTPTGQSQVAYVISSAGRSALQEAQK
jgi:hypothetical protein